MGVQSACWGGGCDTISNDPAVAYNQGIGEADAALAAAIDLGLAEFDGSGTIVYYDLEGYGGADPTCRIAAQSFIDGWTARLHQRGSEAGVYTSSCGGAISDFASISNVPDAIWPAHWIYSYYNADATVWDVACLPDSLWANHQRIRQYSGGHNETWGSVTLNIDCDVIDGIVANAGPNINDILFSDTFSDGNMNGWTVVDVLNANEGPSDWHVADAVFMSSLVLRQGSNIWEATYNLGSYVHMEQDWWTDYHMDIDFYPSDNDAISFLFRYVDEGNYYRFLMHNELGISRLERAVGGVHTTLAENSSSVYQQGRWSNVHISALGETIKVALDYVPVFSVSDSSLLTGTIGLGTSGCEACDFDNVVVATSAMDPYADAIVNADVDTAGNSNADPVLALGRPHGQWDGLALGGTGHWVILDMGQNEEIIDKPGNDLRIYENGVTAGGEDEPYAVSVSDSPDGPWKNIGEGSAISEFDISTSGLGSARYVRIDDLSTSIESITPGADIDAVQATSTVGDIIVEAPRSFTMMTSGNDVVLSWDPVDRAEAYNVYASRLGNSVGYNFLDSVVPSLTRTDRITYIHEDAADDEFFYVITAVGPGGFESSFSFEVPYRIFLPIVTRD
jgi:hypothetical protein